MLNDVCPGAAQAVNHDKDVRTVAMDDLCDELEKDRALDPGMQQK